MAKGIFMQWDVYVIREREVTQSESDRVRARMMYILTGDKKLRSEMLSIAGKVSAAILHDRERKRKNKKSGFYKRSDRERNVKRRETHSIDAVSNRDCDATMIRSKTKSPRMGKFTLEGDFTRLKVEMEFEEMQNSSDIAMDEEESHIEEEVKTNGAEDDSLE